MRMKAAVMYAPKQPLVVEDVELDAPKGGEVLVKMVATGVCHSDLHVYTGDDPDDPKSKLVLLSDAGEVVRGPKASPGEQDAFPARCKPGRVSHFSSCPNAAGHRRKPAAR